MYVYFVLLFPQAENIQILDMDLPTRTTIDYQEPVIAPTVAAALRDALRDEDEIQVDAFGFYSSLGPTPPASAISSLKKPKSGYVVSCKLSFSCQYHMLYLFNDSIFNSVQFVCSTKSQQYKDFTVLSCSLAGSWIICFLSGNKINHRTCLLSPNV